MDESQRSGLEASVEPGELWLIEQSSQMELCQFDCRALTSADVVIYDRELASVIAHLLPTGGYAEPLSLDGAAHPEISPRALRFAAEGWGVVQVVEIRRGGRQRLHGAAEALSRLQADDLPLRAVAKGVADRHLLWDGRLRNLAELIDKIDVEDPLTVILGPPVVRHPARLYAFAGNGLAG